MDNQKDKYQQLWIFRINSRGKRFQNFVQICFFSSKENVCVDVE